MPAPTEQAAEHSENQSFNTVADAVAELDRRDAARRAERKAAKADPKQAKAAAGDEGEGEEGQEDDDDADPRHVDKSKAKKVDSDKEDKKPPRAAKEAEDEEGDGDADADDDQDDDADPDADEEEDDDAKRKAKKAAAADDDDDSVEIEHEGQKHRVPKALKDSFMRHGDYTQKTQQLAQERQVVHQAYGQAQTSLQQLTQVQSTLAQFAQAVLGEEPPLELARADPGEYAHQRALHDNRRKAMEHILEQGNAMQAEQQRMQQEQRAQQLQVHKQVLFQQAPELRDDNHRAQFARVAGQYLTQFGFSPNDAMAIEDSRTLLLVRRLLHLEHAAHERSKAAGTVQKRLADVPNKTHKPGAADAPGAAKSRNKDEAKKRFMRSSKSMKDVERYLAATS